VPAGRATHKKPGTTAKPTKHTEHFATEERASSCRTLTKLIEIRRHAVLVTAVLTAHGAPAAEEATGFRPPRASRAWRATEKTLRFDKALRYIGDEHIGLPGTSQNV